MNRKELVRQDQPKFLIQNNTNSEKRQRLESNKQSEISECYHKLNMLKIDDENEFHQNSFAYNPKLLKNLPSNIINDDTNPLLKEDIDNFKYDSDYMSTISFDNSSFGLFSWREIKDFRF